MLQSIETLQVTFKLKGKIKQINISMSVSVRMVMWGSLKSI